MQDSGAQGPAAATMEKKLSLLLLGGVMVSFLLVTGGAILEICRNGVDPVNFHSPALQPIHIAQLGTLLTDALALRPRAVIMLGVFALVITPILRMMVSILLFLKKGDYLYVCITLFVLLIVLFSLAFSLGVRH